MDERSNGRLFGQLVKLVGELSNARSVHLSCLGDEDHVAFHVSSGFVVLSVGDLPRKVGHKKQGVGDEADRVIQDLGRRERLVTTLVGHDPEAGAEQALDESVSSPQSGASGGRGDRLGSHVVVEEVEGGCKRGNVASDIVQALSCGALEAVLWDGIADVLDGVIRDLERVAVRVQEGAAGVLDLCVVDGAQGRERGVRRRAGRRVEGRGGCRVGRRRLHRVGGDIALHHRVLGTGGGSHDGGEGWGGRVSE